MSILEITGLTHTFGDHKLYKDASFILNRGEHIGIVGQNGTGKSTLIRICTQQMVPDEGRVMLQPGITIGYLDQHAEIDREITMMAFLKSAFRGLYDLERELERMYQQAAEGKTNCLEIAAGYQEQLEASGFYTIDTRVEQVVHGLGLPVAGLSRPMGEMSSGQRAKAIPGKLLLEQPDLILLDEPTNFLDQEHVAWLAGYLSGMENAYLAVSHDTAFLEKISNRICDIDNNTITKYHGTYSDYLKKKTLLRKDYVRQYAAQQREIN